MNVTTTTITMIVQQPSLTESITAVGAFAAFIVSLFTLWFTSLKGPNIVLCERPQFIQKKIPRETFVHIIPDTIFFETNLTFLNNGTASGVFGLSAHFEPVNELSSFFKRYGFMFGTEPHKFTSSLTMLPTSIGEKGSIVVNITLTVVFHDWKNRFVHEPVSKEEVREVLCQADKENRRRFSEFCAVLKADMHIGTVSIKSYQTTRKGMEERVLVDSQHIGVFDEELIRDFRSWEERWDTIHPDAILAELRRIREEYRKNLCEPVEQNLKKLKGLVPISSLETDLLDSVRRRFDGFETRTAVNDFILRSAQLDTRLKEYDSRTEEWNRKFRMLGEQPLNARLAEIFRAESDELKKESEHLCVEITNLLNTLQECYMSNP